MGGCLVSPPAASLGLSQIPRSIHLSDPTKLSLSSSLPLVGLQHGFDKAPSNSTLARTSLCTKAVLSGFPNQKQYAKVAAESTGPVSTNQLLQVVETAAKTGAKVVMDAVNRPRSITYKGLTDLVTDTDKMSEAAILEVVRKNFTDHLILGEEGGLIGDSFSDYLWCIDPLG
ncbi:Inositol-phosphate phosphatase [Bertholletia excelsa]